MVIHTYIDNSSNHSPTNKYYRDSPVTGRSPIKANVFHRYTGNRKKKYCVCGRALIYFKDAECFACTECGRTEYLQQPEQQQQIQQQGIGGIASVDGLSDVRTTPNRAATKFKSIKDPRSRFLKAKPQYDVEIQKLVDEQGVTIQKYVERIEESSEVLSQEELRANK